MNEKIVLDLHAAEATDRTVRKDAAENRQRILLTAEQLFKERGVASVNMAEIAEAAHVGKGTLYRHFAHKGEVCLALMDSQLKAFQDAQLANLREMSEIGTPYLQQLSAFLDSLVAFTQQHMPYLCEVQQYSERLDDAEIQRPHFWQYVTVHGLLQQAIGSGELSPDVDPPVIAEALLAPLAASTYRFQTQVLMFTPERIRATMRVLVDGLRYA